MNCIKYLEHLYVPGVDLIISSRPRAYRYTTVSDERGEHLQHLYNFLLFRVLDGYYD